MEGDLSILRKSVRDFASKHVTPLARKIDAENWYPRELVREMGRMGILAPNAPEDLGGAGLDLLGVSVVLEELARFSGSVALISEVQGTLVTHILTNNAPKRIAEEVIPRLASGDTIGSFALSEPCCGSDAANIETSIERQGGEWVVKGTKTWITQGLYADYFIVFGRTGPRSERHRNIAAVLLRRNICIKTNPIEVMGFRGTGTAEVVIDECRVGDDDIIAPPGEGFKIAMDALNVGRVAISALGVGLAEAAYEEAYSFLAQRIAFEKPIIEFQAIQFTLAELYTLIESSRSLVYRAAELYRKGSEDFPVMAALTKLHSSQASVRVANEAVRLMGGYGYSKESNVERIYRDSKLLEIGEGTNEILKLVISKHLLRHGAKWLL
ncbi:MAG TPA: acyl-CoA dehydrogenase family protein [Sulfolobales archaeon]|nr:acyl-CoA dehydrogenase family protein [Sulfolobales archaeon]